MLFCEMMRGTSEFYNPTEKWKAAIHAKKMFASVVKQSTIHFAWKEIHKKNLQLDHYKCRGVLSNLVGSSLVGSM